MFVLQDRFSVDDRSRVALPRIKNVVDDRECCDTASDNHGPIHQLGRRVNLSWPKAEEDDEQQVANSHRIVRNAKLALETTRSPGEAAIVALGVVGRRVEDVELVVVVVEIAADAAPKEQPDG